MGGNWETKSLITDCYIAAFNCQSAESSNPILKVKKIDVGDKA